MERTDNLEITIIDDKLQYFVDTLNGKENIDEAICVDVISPDAWYMKDSGYIDIKNYVNNNQYIILKKHHK